MKPKEGAAEKTVDSVIGAIGLVWDWLGAEPKAKKDNSETGIEKVRPPTDAIDVDGREV
jgi:hypothetical protein